MVDDSHKQRSDSGKTYPPGCYDVAVKELVVRLRLRENVMLLSVTASLAVFAMALNNDRSDLNLLLIVPHIGFAASLLFAQQHSMVSAMYGYFRDVGDPGEYFILSRRNPWHAHERFFNHLVQNHAQLKRYAGRSFLLHGPSIGALYLSAMQPLVIVGVFWHASLWASVLAIFIHLGSEVRRRRMYSQFATQAVQCTFEDGSGVSMPHSKLEKCVFEHSPWVALAVGILILSLGTWYGIRHDIAFLDFSVLATSTSSSSLQMPVD